MGDALGAENNGSPRGLATDELIPEQEAVVDGTHGPTLLLAGAGTGKTRTVIHFAARLLREGVAPERILLTTFTNKATDEMKSRLRQAGGSSAARVHVSTLHAFATMQLRRDATLIGRTPDFSIWDRDQAERALKRILKPRHAADRKFPAADEVLAVFSYAKNALLTVEQTIRKQFPELERYASELSKVLQEYDSLKTQQNALDFDDLLLSFYALLQKDETVRRQIESAYDWIVVDEGHDTCRIQFETLRLLRRANHSVLFIGDPSQSIYSFRAADPSIIDRFRQEFDHVTERRLSRNFRSTQQILDFANAQIEENDHDKCGRLVNHWGQQGPRPAVVHVHDEDEEVTEIVARVLEHRAADPGTTIAILFRANAAYPEHAIRIETRLRQEGIPVVMRGIESFYESQQVRDVLAFLRVTGNRRDLASLERCLLLLEGVGDAKAAKVVTWESQNRNGRPSYFGTSGPARMPGELSVVTKFREWVEHCRTLPPSDRISFFVQQFYAAYAREKFDNASERLSRLELLADLARPHENLHSFLDECLLGDVVHRPEEREAPDSVIISSIHQAKGLEWHHVLVPLYVDNLFPHSKALEGDLEEERRVAYVAQTRARQTLTFFVPRQAKGQPFDPSRFLQEIPEELYLTHPPSGNTEALDDEARLEEAIHRAINATTSRSKGMRGNTVQKPR